MTDHIEEAAVKYVMRYGGMCRDCADMDGVCSSGMPCDTEQRKAVVRHTLAALTYGIKHGFINNPFADAAAALAAAEERGRMAERERCDEIVRAAWGQNVTIGFLSEAIAKEPTHTNPQRNNYTERYDGID